MKTTIKREVAVKRSGRVMQVEGLFDVPPSERSVKEWEVDLPVEEREWSVGLIVGPSGCGKTTVAREIFGQELVTGYDWEPDRAIVDCFPDGMSVKQITKLLTRVGLGNVPAWLRPFGVLSNGEQFRATMARALAEEQGMVVVDEFTSVVDRQVAKVIAHCTQKTVRAEQRQFVAVSCHYDIVDWLQPDWIYEPASRRHNWRRLRCRPELDFRIHRIDKAAWTTFAPHHYMSSSLHTAAKLFGGFIGGQCVAMVAIRHMPHPKVKNIWQSSRVVVLPDYQGLGLGTRLNDWVGEFLIKRGERFRINMTHPAMIAYCSRSPAWKKCAKMKQNRGSLCFGSSRILALSTFEYVGSG